MQTLLQAQARSGEAGAPIYSPIKGLKKDNVHIRRGQLSMIAGGSGSGKSALMQAIAHFGDGSGSVNHYLYVSSDSGPEVMYPRAASLSTGMTSEAVRKRIKEGRTAEIDAAIAVHHGHVKYTFPEKITRDGVEGELSAHVELNGCYPEVLVIDNLVDMTPEDDADEFRAAADELAWLKGVARKTGMAVIALHHVTGEHSNGQAPIGLNGIRGKVDKHQGLIMTIHRPHDGEMRVSVVKNRNGKVDASGRYWVPLNVDLDRMHFEG